MFLPVLIVISFFPFFTKAIGSLIFCPSPLIWISETFTPLKKTSAGLEYEVVILFCPMALAI